MNLRLKNMLYVKLIAEAERLSVERDLIRENMNELARVQAKNFDDSKRISREILKRYDAMEKEK